MNVRPTTVDDVPALFAVFNSAIGEIYQRHAFEPPAPPLEVFANQQEHVLAHDGSRCVVAEVDGEPVAFAGAWARGEAWFLASLFVRPDVQARGVGTTLLDAVWGDGFARRLTITDAIQPVSNAVYARRGLIPATPVLGLSGVPRVDAPRDLDPVDVSAEELRRVDEIAYGFDRAVDHAYWLQHARRTGWARAGEVVAWSYVFPGGAVGPVAGADPAAAAAALAGELARAGGRVRVRAPGSARAAVAVALAAGLRLDPAPGLLLLSDGVAPPEALVIGSYTLL